MKLFVIASVLSLISSAAYAAETAPHFVYVESNATSANSILAYQEGSDGSLQALPGSPFQTGGTGFFDSSFALGPFDSDQNVIVNPEHTLLFAVNSGSNTIAVFHIASDGSLSAVTGSPFNSQGIQPVSVGYDNGTLIVVNKHQDPAQASDQSLPNYTTFKVNNDGSLSAISNSTISVANGSSPAQALVYRNLVFGADFLGGLLQSFELSNGRLRQNPPQALPDSEFQGVAAPHAPLGLEVNPRTPVLYVGYPTASKVGVYAIAQSGEPQFGKTVPNSGMAVCWLRSNRVGNRLYTSNSADHSVSVYDTTNPYEPKEIQKLVVNAEGGLFQIELDPTGAFAYVIEQRSAGTIPQGQANAIHVLKLDANGLVTELTNEQISLSLPDNTRPQGIAAF